MILQGSDYKYLSLAKIKKRFNKFCSKKKSNCGGENKWEECYSIDHQEKQNMKHYYRSFPIFTFYFGLGKAYKLYPSDYLVRDGDLDQYCVGIQSREDMVLGAVFMRNYDILFDKTRKLIGFARADCSNSGNVDYYNEDGDDYLKKVF